MMDKELARWMGWVEQMDKNGKERKQKYISRSIDALDDSH